nr:uncharacterized protein LOC127347544 [Lolium perenne]
MSGKFDPTRTSKLELTKAQIAKRVNFVSLAKLPDNWDWGMEPYNRDELPPVVSLFSSGRIPACGCAAGLCLTVFLFVRSSSPVSRLRMVTWSRRSGRRIMKIWLTKQATTRARRRLSKPPRGTRSAAVFATAWEEQEEEQVPPASVPLRAVPLSMRPPAASTASSTAPKGKKRASDWTTAQLEAKVMKQRRAGPKKVPETAGAAIKFSKGGTSRPTPNVVSPLPRQRREPTPQPRPSTPPVVVPPVSTPPAAGAGSSVAPSPGAPGSFSRSEPVRSSTQPSLDDLFPCRSRLIEPAAGAGKGAPGAAGAGKGAPGAAGAGGAAPNVVILDASSDETPPVPKSTILVGSTVSTAPPPSSEPAWEEPVEREPARSAEADARALVTTKGPTQAPQGLHVSPAASLLNVVSASDSSFGSAGTMEKDWLQADACEVTSQNGRKGVAPMEMFFSGFRAFAKAQAAEAEGRLARLEAAEKVVADRRTALYNRLVASYHKAKK